MNDQDVQMCLKAGMDILVFHGIPSVPGIESRQNPFFAAFGLPAHRSCCYWGIATKVIGCRELRPSWFSFIPGKHGGDMIIAAAIAN